MIEMVGKKSEYQKQFSTTVLTKHIPTYEANLECRYKRRDEQFAHTSIAWDDSDSTSEEEVKQTEKKLEELNINGEESVESKKPDYVEFDLGKKDKFTSPRSSSDNNNIVSCEKPELDKVAKLNFGKTRVITPSRKKKLKRPDRDQKIPKTRPASTPAKHTVSAHPKDVKSSKQRIPFLSYGAGDGDKVTGILWTHNVLPDTEVYPSALRAKQKRELQAKKHHEQLDKYVWLNDRKKNAILKLMKKETGDWETEYQKHYPAYDKIVYERALSARPDCSCRGEY